MSKVAAYLRGHITGEVVTRGDVRSALATDFGVLQITPEMVMYPRSTNDIRKIARFAWQLAERGHVLPLTIRGSGTDSTGAALGKGALIITNAHLNRIYEYDAKQKLVRLQPGATIAAVQSALGLHGAAIMSLLGSHEYGTVGGAIANAVAGPFAGKYGTIERSVEQLEVVLANGDVIQTGRVNKRELSRKKGLQGLEGDIYRGIDSILEEYDDVLDRLQANDATGYNTIADVKQKDGSFDLTPLFIGSQGTLGFISEMIMRAEIKSHHYGMAALCFESGEAARDALDNLARFNPAILEYFDGTLFREAAQSGRTYQFFAAWEGTTDPESVVIIGFDDINERARQKHLKKIVKMFEKADNVVVTIDDADETGDLMVALDVATFLIRPDQGDNAASEALSGFHVPTARLEDFTKGLKELADKEHTELPLTGHVITNIYTVYPSLALHKVGDKQKVLKLITELTKLVYQHGGTMIAEGGEGRLKGHAIYHQLDEKVVAMYAAVRNVFDPMGTLNPGVKQAADARTLAGMLRDRPESGQTARFGL